MSDVMRSTYRTLSEQEQRQLHTIKLFGTDFYEYLDSMEAGDKRCFALAKTKIEEAVMWATKGMTL